MESGAIHHLMPDDLPKVPLVMNGISSRFIREFRVVPVEMRENRLKIAAADPGNRFAVDALRVATGADIEVCSADADVIDEYINRYYGPDQQNFSKIIEDIGETGATVVSDEEESVGHLRDLASEAPVIRLVNLLITRAVELRASDIHIEPFEDALQVRYRIDGVLHEVESAPRRLQAAIVSRIKIMARLNIAERRLPQDGRIQLKIAGREIDLRISTIPVLHGESVVMRILQQEGIRIDLDTLGFPPEALADFNRLITRPNGIILVTGPTGSGKTTTLYGALDKINSPDRKIITVEDPIEYQLRGINQIQVKPQIGLTFANTLRHIVRQDPDIILIGEIRDLETAEIAIQSALTGHLVFSTLHTNDAPSAVTRLLEMGVQNFLLASTVRGILAQRLVRVICPSCRHEVPDQERRADGIPFGIPPDAPQYSGTGCEQCAHTGFFGRTGIFELLLVNDDIRKLILTSTDASEIGRVARKFGMRTLLEDGIGKVRQGITTLSEVLRVTQEV